MDRARIMVRVAISTESSDGEEHIEAVLDTGATRSVISSALVNRLNATPHGTALVTGIKGDPEQRATYFVEIRVPVSQFKTSPDEHDFRSRTEAADWPQRFQGRNPYVPCDVLLGMDLINQWHTTISEDRCTIRW